MAAIPKIKSDEGLLSYHYFPNHNFYVFPEFVIYWGKFLNLNFIVWPDIVLYNNNNIVVFSGPSHKKNFTVCLKLGDTEEYLATGPSIKKAQHAAAAMALEKTKLKHPLPKPKPCTKQGK